MPRLRPPRRPLLLARLVGARPDDDTVGEAVAELRLLAAPDPRLLMPLDGIFNEVSKLTTYDVPDKP